jgi:diadenosine tetraphosphate (Ap4A) HIT family hydrolase
LTALDRIWAGWRSEYVTSAAGEDDDDDGCVLCRVIDDGSSVVWRDEAAAVILNAYPYTSGHVMVLPVSHVGELEELDWEQAAEIWAALADTVRAIKEAYAPHGLNIGANIGRVAGAGVPGHFHLHVLPRWNGDTNFMTTIAEARVLPEALPVTLEKLQKAWPS